MDPLWTVGVPVVRALMSIVFDIRVEGDRHVPRTGPAIIAPNHISVLDGPLLTVLTASVPHEGRVLDARLGDAYGDRLGAV